MTDIQEQPQPAASDSASATAGSTPPSAAAASRPAAKASAAKAPASKSSPAKSSLSAKLLPELQQIAGGLGINTSKKKKADLVAAIQAARSGSAPTAAAAKGDAPTTSAPKSDAPTSLTSEAPKSDAPRTRERRIATSASGAPPSTSVGAPPSTSVDAPTADQPEPTRRERPRRERPARTVAASTDPGSSDAPAGAEAAPATDTDRQQNDRSQNDRQQGDRQRSQNNGGAPNAQRNDRNGAQNNGQRNENNQRNDGGQNNGQRNDNNQRNEGQNNGQRNEAPRDDDDDFDGRGRRGRRYRDRRGRNRDRQGGTVGGSGQTGNTDVEPTITEDDVLVPVGGVLDCLEDNKSNWYIRVEGYFASPDDVFVANSFVRRYNLRRGDAVTGTVRQAKDGERREKYNPLVRLDSVNGRDPESLKNRVEFTKLTPLYPQERLRLETEPHILTTRVIDLVMPIGKGQRALIVSPPKAGKTMVLQAIANAIVVNNPEAHLMVVLVDERPEEVTDMQRSVKGEVIASTFDRRPQDHIAVAELSIERAKRLVEMGHDVVVLLDSITRLGRAYNLGAPASGRILSGGVDSQALYQPKRFLGAARNIENGGSLTIIATALVETGSAGDTVFFEEYKGTGNAELKLDRKIADKRIFPAIDVDQSSTRKEELLLSPDELAVTIKLRRVLHSLEQQQAIELLLDRLRKTRTNIEFLMQIAKTTPGGES